MEQTRHRIVAAAVQLHEERGPLGTSISAIADRAGVQRVTVYSHFPDEPSLFRACTEHYFAAHPPPDLDTWSKIRDPRDRLQHALYELYRYWADTEPMIASVLRDYEADPERVGHGTANYIAAATEAVLAGWRVGPRKRRLLAAALGHAVHFRTWQSLVKDQGIADEEAATLMARFVISCATGGRRGQVLRSGVSR